VSATTYRRAPHVLHRNAGPDVVAMLPDDEKLHVLSGPAAVMWDLLSGDVTRDELIGEIANMYTQPVEDVAPELDGCLRDLADRGLVEERRA
jgi:hypothetical protein